MPTLPVQRLLVRSLDVERREVTWEVSDTQEDARDYTFQIYRSESPEGPFEPVTDLFEDRYIFVDWRIPTGDKFRQLWYKLRVTHKATAKVVDHGPETNQAEPDLVASYIRKSEQTLFTQVTGRLCWLFKRRTFGARCRSCWDPQTDKRTRSGCLDCFNTGFLRGYHDPIEVWVQIDPETKSKQNNAQQIDQQLMTSGRMTFYPNVNPSDVLVEAENKRWRINKVTLTERLRAPIRQELVMNRIQETDIEYRIPINLDSVLRDIQPSPPRMFTNPTDLQSAIDRRIPNVFANYPTYPGNAKEE